MKCKLYLPCTSPSKAKAITSSLALMLLGQWTDEMMRSGAGWYICKGFIHLYPFCTPFQDNYVSR